MEQLFDRAVSHVLKEVVEVVRSIIQEVEEIGEVLVLQISVMGQGDDTWRSGSR